MRSNTLDAARRAYLGLVRGTIHKANDQPLMQTNEVRLLHDELLTDVERFQPALSFTAVPLPPEGKKAAEVIVGFINGLRSHPVVLSIDDRRHRPKNFKPGESAHYDDQRQVNKIARDGYYATAKKHTFTAGDKPEMSNFELNEQLKGLSARISQNESHIAGLFDVTSKFRAIVQGAIPQVAAVAPILSAAPGGLDMMEAAIAGDAGSNYLQKQMSQALGKFLASPVAGVQSLLSGGLEGSIGSLQGQISGLAAGNPVVGMVDDLVQEGADLASSGADPSIITNAGGAIAAKVAALTSANPIVGIVSGLRSTLSGLMSQAGPSLNFLGPQKRLVQGKSKSLRLTKAD